MAKHIVATNGLADALGLGFSFLDLFEDESAELTTEHPSASRGLPVLVKDGVAYGPADLPNVTVFLGNTEASGSELIGPAQAAGWRVHVQDLA